MPSVAETRSLLKPSRAVALQGALGALGACPPTGLSELHGLAVVAMWMLSWLDSVLVDIVLLRADAAVMSGVAGAR